MGKLKQVSVKIGMYLLTAGLLLAGVIVMLVIYGLITRIDLKNISVSTENTLAFLQSTCQKYDDYQLGNTTKDLQTLINKAKILAGYAEPEEIQDPGFLSEYMKKQNLSGIMVVDADRDIIVQVDRWQKDNSGLLAFLLTESNLQDVMLYPQKRYADQVRIEEDSYSYSIVAREDEEGVIICYDDTTDMAEDDNEFTLNSLLGGDTFQDGAIIVITDGEKVLCSNYENLAGLSVEDCPVSDITVQQEKGLAGEKELIRINAQNSVWYGEHSLYRDYYLYAFYTEDSVFAGRFFAIVFAAGIYLVLCLLGVILWQYVKREKLQQMEKEYHLISTIASIYSANLLIDIEENTWKPVVDSDRMKQVIDRIPEADEMLKAFIRERVRDTSQEEFYKFVDMSTLEQRLKGANFVGYSFEDVEGMFYQTLLIPQRSRADGRIRKVTFVIRNVTEQKKKELQYQEELRRIAEEARKANDAKTVFLRRMSHDIRTPINGIRGFVDIGRTCADDEQRVLECFDKIGKASDFLLDLVNNVLNMSKLETGEIYLEEKPFDLREVLNEATAIIEAQAAEKNLTFEEKDTHVEHWHLLGSPLHLRQIIQNIMGNAVKYNRENGRITVGCRELEVQGDMALFELRCADTGIGMSKEFQKHAFELFTQERDDARTSYEGTGLGLSIVKKLVDCMDGEIHIDSEEGRGTTVTLKLTMKIDRNYYEREASGEQQAVSIAGVRILVVEDNELNMEIAEYMFTERGAVVEKAANGKKALEMFAASEEGYYDVIMMDIMMPEMDGLEATRRIRGMDRTDAKTVPIFAMSANAFDDDVARSRAAGMNEHLSKPLSFEKAAAVIARYVRKKEE